MSQKDHFQRHKFASDLISMVKSLPTPFSFGLDADWGAGKTFFINNVLQHEAKQKSLPCLVYDAFEHEKEDDVFLSLMTSILEQSQLLATESEGVNSAIHNVIQKTAKVATTVGSIALNAGARFVLKQGLEELTEKFTPDTTLPESFSAELEKGVTTFLQERLKSGQSYKVIKSEFQSSIKQLASNLSEEDGKILVIIDELDRCSPNHALQVLEATHHLLNTEGLIFMFSYNRDQLEALVEHAYGSGIKAGEYLQKFVSLNFKFPAIDPYNLVDANSSIIEDRAAIHSNSKKNENLTNTLIRISRWSQVVPMTPRQLQQYTSITLTVTKKLRNDIREYLSNAEIAALIYWKLTSPKALAKLLCRTTKLNEKTKIMDELKYDEFLPVNGNQPEILADFLREDRKMSEPQTDSIYAGLQVFITLS